MLHRLLRDQKIPSALMLSIGCIAEFGNAAGWADTRKIRRTLHPPNSGTECPVKHQVASTCFQASFTARWQVS